MGDDFSGTRIYTKNKNNETREQESYLPRSSTIYLEKRMSIKWEVFGKYLNNPKIKFEVIN